MIADEITNARRREPETRDRVLFVRHDYATLASVGTRLDTVGETMTGCFGVFGSRTFGGNELSHNANDFSVKICVFVIQADEFAGLHPGRKIEQGSGGFLLEKFFF